MNFYTRKQVIEILGFDDGFLIALETEEVVERDAAPDSNAPYSDRMLERARVAHRLIQDLDVNLAGAAIIVRLREEIVELRQQLIELARLHQ